MRRILLLAGLGIGLGGILFWLGEAPPAPTTAALEPTPAADPAPAAEQPPAEATATGRPHEEPKGETPAPPDPVVPPPPEPPPDETKGRCGELDDILSARYGAAFSAEAGRLAKEKWPLEQILTNCETWAKLPPEQLAATLDKELGLKPTK